MTLYLIVYNTEVSLNAENCTYLGLPEGATFGDLRDSRTKYNGYTKKKDGNDVWVLPFYADENLVLNPDPEVYEVVDKEGLKAIEFDVEPEAEIPLQ